MTDETAAAYECPECGRLFMRPAALGAHRRRAHGVPGTSRRGPHRSVESRRRDRASGRALLVDHDALLQTVFPSGVPARAEVVTAVHAWLEEAQRLAELGENGGARADPIGAPV